jgi:thiosulfate dehydrogenase [quinone] large subunit
MKLTPAPILILRLAVALFFLHLGYTKIESGWLTSSERLQKSLSYFEQNAPPASKWYIEHIAKPGIDLWSRLIAVGETALGISLFLGLLVRLSTIIGILTVLNFHLTNGTLLSLSLLGNPWAILVIPPLFVLFLTRAGRSFGFDALLAKGKSKSMLY